MSVGQGHNAEHKEIIVRLLNGSLRGCEFRLPAGRTLFLVVDDTTICQQQQGDLLPDNTVYIPGGGASSNFEVLVPENADETVILRRLADGKSQDTAIASDNVIMVDKVSFAWRGIEETFSDHILYGTNEPQIEENESLPAKASSSGGKWIKVLVAGCLLISTASISYYWLTDTQRQVSDISTLLNADNSNYQIIMGKDRQLYVYARDYRMADWAEQTLIKNSASHKAKIVTRQSEQQRVTEWLHREWPQVRFHRVRLDQPQYPVIELSAERSRLPAEQKKRLKTALSQILPCASDISLTTLSDREVKALAEQGLKKIAISYVETVNADSVTFSLQGAIDDAELVRIKDFINYYHQIWGGDYIRFALNIKDDWLKGRSYKYGPDGYIKSSGGHWYFPGKINKEL
ncbi:PrgH/EprH family type III secretion apparatus protein [Kalamiella sp. sgz302252]|uniref:PrgH/EprH family type III secretion apparatus protein n=1 Tax=Pantoea sp. sgz302252 TaxID=3341827 RepID=UPI0036D28FDD